MAAVDHEGKVQKSTSPKQGQKSQLKMKKAFLDHYFNKLIVTDKLGSYGAAAKDSVVHDKQVTGRWANNRAESSSSYPFDDEIDEPCVL